ncbi:MAG: phosphoribosylanthranilate isomerase [Epulopiscium sp.]|nr:phosphoribosylanthranilate isomerase [Candidatus Epulonipiscium sp.]
MLTIPKIKICGLKSPQQIKMINKYDVNYIGLVFAKSKRRISPDIAKEMKVLLRHDIKAVGVFVDTPIEEVNQLIKYCNLDIVQLHGSERPKECSKSIVPVWKAFSIKEKLEPTLLEDYKAVDGFVFDSSSGGSGKTFSWDLIKGVSKNHFIILAGGLNSKNIRAAMDEVQPQVVDVSSGVETDGKKDGEKIREFIMKIKI